MTKNFKFFNTTVRAILGSALLIGLFFIVSCDNGNDEPEPELYPIPGVYTFKKAVIQTDLTVPGIPFPIAKGTDITQQMKDGLLAEAPCKDTDNGAVELKENKELFFACIGEENEAKAGTWSIKTDTTELNLNLSVTSGDLQLKIQELDIDEANDVISGSINNFPITKNLIAGFLGALSEEQRNAILAGIDDNYAVLVSVDISFQKVSE